MGATMASIDRAVAPALSRFVARLPGTLGGFGRLWALGWFIRYGGAWLGFHAGHERLSESPAFAVIVTMAPLLWWGTVFAVLALVGLWVAVAGSRWSFGWVAVVSSVVTTWYAVGFAMTGTWSPAVFAYATFALYDVLAAGVRVLPRG